jgi:uncharacterized membrane protein HdeD (DUF308 family)
MSSNNEQLRAAAAGLQNRVSGKMSGIWWAFLVRGLLALGLGVSALIWPRLMLALLIRLIGLYAVLDGAAGVVRSIRNRELQAYLVLALASLAVGAILIFWPGLTVKGLLIILGFWEVLQGANLFLAGRGAENGDPNRGLLTTTGTVLAVIGLVLIIWPGVGVITISWLVAALAFLMGALLVFLALRLRRVRLRVDSLGKLSRQLGLLSMSRNTRSPGIHTGLRIATQ